MLPPLGSVPVIYNNYPEIGTWDASSDPEYFNFYVYCSFRIIRAVA
jgi:hypothetical protein